MIDEFAQTIENIIKYESASIKNLYYHHHRELQDRFIWKKLLIYGSIILKV